MGNVSIARAPAGPMLTASILSVIAATLGVGQDPEPYTL